MCPTPVKGYHTTAGVSVPGTTTIIGRFKDSGALIGWAYNQGRDGKPRFEKPEADLGTYVHALIEAHLNKQPEPEPPANIPPENVKRARANAFEAFLRWRDGARMAIAPIEVALVSEKFLYGGTPDASGCEHDDQMSIIDWKSAKDFYPDNLIQGAAYINLWNEAYPKSPIDGFLHVIRFGKEGMDFAQHSFRIDHPRLQAAWRLFKLYRQAWDEDKIVSWKA
jgi:hypothetical protein